MSIEKTQAATEAYLAHVKEVVQHLERGVILGRENPESVYSTLSCLKLFFGVKLFHQNLENLFCAMIEAATPKDE